MTVEGSEVELTPEEAIGALAHASWQAAQAGARNSSALQSGEALFASLRGAGIVLVKRSRRAAITELDRVRERIHGKNSPVTFPERCIPDEIKAIVAVLHEHEDRLRGME